MKKARVFLVIFLAAIFVVLGIALFLNYKELEQANEYIAHITDSTNAIIGEVDAVNSRLDSLSDYEESVTLETDIDEIILALQNAREERKEFDIPYNAEEVEELYDEFLHITEDVIVDLQNLQISIGSLEDSETFTIKLNTYVRDSESLNAKSEALQKALNEYTEQHNNLDFGRVLHGIQSL